MSAAKKKDDKGGKSTGKGPDPLRISGGLWNDLWRYALVLGGVGLALSIFGWSADPHRFAYSWLFAFFTFLTIAFGAMFFVMVNHVTSAGWSVTSRRTAEFFFAAIPVFAILFVPVWIERDELYAEWLDHGHGAHDAPAHGDEHASLFVGTAHAQDGAGDHGDAEARRGAEHAAAHTPEHVLHGSLIEHKSGFLNLPFWTLRALLYFVIWTLLALLYFRWSTEQDTTKDPALTRKMNGLAPVGLFLFGVTLTFAAIDWVMSLNATWYSTIFGVYVFAGAAMAIHAIITLVTLSLKSQGLLGDAVNTEHYHDLGKLMFGFNVFWAYIGFSQMMLIWYAAIPEEQTFYHHRWNDGGWATFSWLLLLGHFVLPFLFLISRMVKRRAGLLGFGAAWMLVLHVLDIYWFVMPTYSKGELVMHWLDVACLLAVGGLYLAAVTGMMRRFPLIPVGDPRLPRALAHVNP